MNLDHPRPPAGSARSASKMSEVVAALSSALDITEGQSEGHAVRTAIIGMRLAAEVRLPSHDRSALLYALLLKDLGCSSNASKLASLFQADDLAIKHDLKMTDWSRLSATFLYVVRHAAPGAPAFRRAARVAAIGLEGKSGVRELFRARCEQGGEIARLLGFSDETAQAIRCMDEHWDGRGYPQGMRGDEIPLLSRLVGLAQTFEVYFTAHGLDAALGMARARRGKWFDPDLVDALAAVGKDAWFWERLRQGNLEAQIAALEPPECTLVADAERVDLLAEGFARVIDAKSPWTYRHSEGVTEIAVGVGQILGFTPEEIHDLRRAALLHDLGKLGISNRILDKPGPLTEEERAAVRRHPESTQRILERVEPFRGIAVMASAHHERLDGTGYHRGLKGDQIPRGARVLAVADICEALTADRPHRPRQPIESVMEILERDAGKGICPECFEALHLFFERRSRLPRRKLPALAAAS